MFCFDSANLGGSGFAFSDSIIKDEVKLQRKNTVPKKTSSHDENSGDEEI